MQSATKQSATQLDSEGAEPAAIFLHIPKTAGSTLYQIINRNYQKRHIYTIWQDGTLDEFKDLSDARRSKIRLLRGHAGYGIHQNLPRPAIYFTLLRDPIERVISYYHFVRRTPAHYCHDQVRSDNMSLGEFIESKIDRMVDNGQSRLLGGLETGHELEFGECTEELLQTAKKNLRENISVVGLTEEFDATLLLLKRYFGWHQIFYTRQNVSSNRLHRDELPKSTSEAIREVNQLDLDLYQTAETLFRESLSEQGDAFDQAVRSFQRLNRLFTPLTAIYLKCRRKYHTARWRIQTTSPRAIVRRVVSQRFDNHLL